MVRLIDRAGHIHTTSTYVYGPRAVILIILRRPIIVPRLTCSAFFFVFIFLLLILARHKILTRLRLAAPYAAVAAAFGIDDTTDSAIAANPRW